MKTRRFLAWVVTALMLLTAIAMPAPFSALREAEASTLADSQTPTPPTKVPHTSSEARATSGKCGPNLYWSFNTSTGVLTITGSGAMYDYLGDDEYSPWTDNGYYDDIRSVSLPKGLTHIGGYAFFYCTVLTSITIPSKVKTIGYAAFAKCPSLTTVTLPKSVKTIGAYAFYDCPALRQVIYQAKADDRVKIVIQSGNDELLTASWRYTKANTAALAIKTQPKNITIDEGKVASFKIKATGATMIRWQYREPGSSTWKDTGVTADTFSVMGTTLYSGYSFRAVVTNGTASLYSSAATLNVRLVQLAIKTQPKTIKANAGKTVTFKVKAVGATNYDWQVKFAGSSTWYSLDYNSETFSFTADADLDGMSVRCKAANDRGGAIYSNVAKLCVNITITQKPKAVTVSEGDLAKFTVAGTGYTKIQWEYQWPGSKTWYEVGGGTSETCTIQAKTSYNGVVFRAKLYNSTTVKYTAKAKLTVKAASLAIKQQPVSVTVAEGEYASFSVTATGATSYAWEYKLPSSSSWSDLGATSSSFKIQAKAAYNGIAFRCKVSNSTKSIYSNAATMTVRSQTPTGSNRALLIGESDYDENPLPGGVYNASSMAGMLKGLSNSFSTTTLTNCSSTQILNGIKSAYAGATDSSVSLFYYSGHGAQSSYQPYLGALCPVSGEIITMSQLATELSKVKGRVIVILDSCHSGAAIGKDGSKDLLRAHTQAVIDAFSGYRIEASEEDVAKYGELATSKFIVITAARSDEVCWNTLYWGIDGGDYSQGFFTAAFIKGMGCTYPNGTYSGSMPADTDGNKQITLKEIFSYAYDLALYWSDDMDLSWQHAQYYGPDSEVLFKR